MKNKKYKKSVIYLSLTSDRFHERQVKIKAGFSLVEVLVTLMILSIGVSSVVTLMTLNTKNLINTKNQIIASQLAQEGVELVRNLRDNNVNFVTEIEGENYRVDYDFDYNDFRTSGVNSFPQKKLYLDSGSGFYTHTSAGGTTPTKFYRKIKVTTVDGNKQVEGIVIWSGTEFPDACSSANNCTSIIAVFPGA